MLFIDSLVQNNALEQTIVNDKFKRWSCRILYDVILIVFCLSVPKFDIILEFASAVQVSSLNYIAPVVFYRVYD